MDEQKCNQAIESMARNCLAVRLRLLNRVITNLYDEALRPLGLKVSQLNIMVVTGKLELARPAEVCRILCLDASTLSRNVERMRANGWLEAVPGDDARMQPFRLTAKGRVLLARALPAWQQAQDKAVAFLGHDGLSLLDGAAQRLRALGGS